MKKPESAAAGSSHRRRRHKRLRRLHRWLGLTCIVFLLILSITGVALNHSDELGLERRFLGSSWLLDWYGFNVPEPAASYAVEQQRVSLVGNRLYLDATEAARGIRELTGAISWDGLIVATTSESLLYLSADAELVDRLEVGSELPGSIQNSTVDAGRLLLRSEGRVFEYIESSLSAVVLEDASGGVVWSAATPVPAELLAEIHLSYRGPGLSVERLLYDLHSGRWLAGAGVWIMDGVAVLIIILSVTGFVLWRRRGT